MSVPLTIFIYTVLVFATSAIGSLTGIGGGVVRKPVFDAMGDFDAAQIAFLNVVTVLAMSLVSILRQSKNFRFEGLGQKKTKARRAIRRGKTDAEITAFSSNGRNAGVPPESAACRTEGRERPAADPDSFRVFLARTAVSSEALGIPSEPAVPLPAAVSPPASSVAAGIPETSEAFPDAAGTSPERAAALTESTAESAERTASTENPDNRPVLSVKNLLLLSAGSVAGGIGGEVLFAALVLGAPDGEVKLVQNIVLLVLVAAVLAYMLFKSKIPTARLKNPVWYVAAGLLLGILASFLGIGGGPMNLAVLMLMFSMSTKEAAYSSLAIILVSQVAKLAISAVSGTILVVTAPLVYASVGFLTAGAVAGGLIGSLLSKKFSDRAVSVSFDLLQIALIAVVVYNIVRAAGTL